MFIFVHEKKDRYVLDNRESVWHNIKQLDNKLKLYLAVAVVFYGAYTAMITGVERAFIAEISPKELKGIMLGLHSTIVGIALQHYFRQA